MFNQWAYQQMAVMQQLAALQHQQQLQQQHQAFANAMHMETGVSAPSSSRNAQQQHQAFANANAGGSAPSSSRNALVAVQLNQASDEHSDGDEDDEKKRTLFCANLDERVTEELLYEVFLQAGPIESVRIPKDSSGRRRTFGFVTYAHAVSPPYAMRLFHGLSLYRKTLSIKFQQSNNAPHTLQHSRSLPGSDSDARTRRSSGHGGSGGGSTSNNNRNKSFDNNSLRSGNYAAFQSDCDAATSAGSSKNSTPAQNPTSAGKPNSSKNANASPLANPFKPGEKTSPNANPFRRDISPSENPFRREPSPSANPFKRDDHSEWTKGRSSNERLAKHSSSQSRPHQNAAPYKRRSGGSEAESHDRSRDHDDDKHGNEYQRRHKQGASNRPSLQRQQNDNRSRR